MQVNPMDIDAELGIDDNVSKELMNFKPKSFALGSSQTNEDWKVVEIKEVIKIKIKEKIVIKEVEKSCNFWE